MDCYVLCVAKIDESDEPLLRNNSDLVTKMLLRSSPRYNYVCIMNKTNYEELKKIIDISPYKIPESHSLLEDNEFLFISHCEDEKIKEIISILEKKNIVDSLEGVKVVNSKIFFDESVKLHVKVYIKCILNGYRMGDRVLSVNIFKKEKVYTDKKPWKK